MLSSLEQILRVIHPGGKSSVDRLTFETVFDDDQKRQEYARALDALWHRAIVDSHESLKAARAILEAPRWLFGLGPNGLLSIIALALIERAALLTINALIDSDPASLTLKSVRTRLQNLCASTVSAQLARELRRGFRRHRLGDMRIRARKLRNNRLAHLNAEFAVNHRRLASILLTFDEVEDLLEHAKALLQVLSLDVVKRPDLIMFGERDDMRYVILQLMRDSKWLRMPEEQGFPLFAAFAGNWSASRRIEYNCWRRKIGMDEVDFDALLSPRGGGS